MGIVGSSRRHRDAVTGEYVTAEEAALRPSETVAETVCGCACRFAALEERIARLEIAVTLGEAGARTLYR
jgi:hypothetical protein